SQSSRASPEPGESDNQGHFIGAASGFNFLLRLQRQLHRAGHAVAPPSLLALGDAALPEFDVQSFTLPSEPDASALVNTYFTLATPTIRFFHRGTVESWLRELYQTALNGLTKPEDRKKAALLIIMANATRYVDPTTTSEATSSSSGILYYQAAERELAREAGPATLIVVQVLLGFCLYTITLTRLGHSWTLFGSISRQILALGLHRRGSQVFGYRKSAVDRYLSAIHGRPSAFHDENIDQDLPRAIDDEHISEVGITAEAQGPFCFMQGPIMHIKLVQIVSRTLRLLYGVRRLSEIGRYSLMAELDKELDLWREALPAHLNPDLVDSALLLPSLQRQSKVLNLAYHHTRLFVYRHSLFSDLRKDTQIPAHEVQANIAKCVNAAMSIANLAGRIVAAKQLFTGSWHAYYQIYCAATVLYTHTFKLTSQDQSTWIEYFRAAELCQSYIATQAVEDSLPYRLQVVIEEYRCEFKRLIKYSNTTVSA
ncbi:uncharacterized protein NECHADRAFT_54383, partial [Fusarium vanettenii 77-13-4]